MFSDVEYYFLEYFKAFIFRVLIFTLYTILIY